MLCFRGEAPCFSSMVERGPWELSGRFHPARPLAEGAEIRTGSCLYNEEEVLT